MKNTLYVKTLVMNNWKCLILSFLLYLVSQMIKNLMKRTVDFKVEEIITVARNYNQLPGLTFLYCSQIDYMHYLLKVLGRVALRSAMMRSLRLFVEYRLQHWRHEFTTRFQAQVLALMLYNHFNLPQLEKPRYQLSMYHEAARDFTQLFYSIFIDIASPIISVFLTIFSSNFHFSFVSIAVPILPLLLTSRFVVKLAHRSKALSKQMMRVNSERQAFIIGLNDRKLLIKSYNSIAFELKFIQDNLQKSHEQAHKLYKLRMAQRLLESFGEAFYKMATNFFRIYFIIVQKFSFYQANDYVITIYNIYKLQDSLTEFSSKTETYSNAYEIVRGVFDYQLEVEPFKGMAEIMNFLISQNSICRDRHCDTVALSDVSTSFGGAPVFAHLNWELEPRFYLLQGESGAGKSTLLKVIDGIYPINRGAVLFDGVAEGDIVNVRSCVTMVHQYDSPIRHLSLQEHITYGLPLNPAKLSEVCAICRVDFENSDATTLSGGQFQRISLARGLYRVYERYILLLDESTNGLDAQLEKEILAGIKHFCATRRIVCILISHRSSCRDAADLTIDIGQLQRRWPSENPMMQLI